MTNLKLLFGIIIVLIILSCSSNDDDETINNDKNLLSITKEHYKNNKLTFTEKFNFDKNKLINIQNSDNSYDDIYYNGDLVSKILEFGSNRELEWTITYTYDNNKLKVKKVTPSRNNPFTNVSRQKEFIYNENIIESKSTWSDNGSHNNSISVNNDNLITEDKLLGGNITFNRYLFEYVNNNLTKSTLKNSEDNTEVETTYNYLNKAASDSYNYTKFLFGKEWKNNSSLNKQFGLGQTKSFEISENYIKNYYSYDFYFNTTRTSTFDYEFDIKENLIKQTQNIKDYNGTRYKIISTYFYE